MEDTANTIQPIDPGVLEFIHPTTDSDGNVTVVASVEMMGKDEYES